VALISCPECGAEVSDKASACPKCACPIHAPEKPVIAKNENESLLIKAEQLYMIGETEEAIDAFIAYTDKYPKDWETQMHVADLCDELLPKYYAAVMRDRRDFIHNPDSHVSDRSEYIFDRLVDLRFRMLQFALLNVPITLHENIIGRLSTDASQIVNKADNSCQNQSDAVPTVSSSPQTPEQTNWKKAIGIGFIILTGMMLFLGLLISDQIISWVTFGISLILGIVLLVRANRTS
jgi:hypothetical protein